MKPRLTVAEHAELGAVLAGISDELTRRYCQIANAYPPAAPQVKYLDSACTQLNAVRNFLDNALADEHPAEFDRVPAVYYPAKQNRARIVCGEPAREGESA